MAFRRALPYLVRLVVKQLVPAVIGTLWAALEHLTVLCATCHQNGTIHGARVALRVKDETKSQNVGPSTVSSSLSAYPFYEYGRELHFFLQYETFSRDLLGYLVYA